MSDAFSAQNSFLSIGDSASPNTFTEIAEVTNIGGPTQTSERIDVTHLRSTSGYREYLQSFKDGGTVECVANYIPSDTSHGSGVNGIRGLLNSGDVRGFKKTFADGTEEFFDGYVSAMNTPLSVGTQALLNFTITVTGAVTADEAP